MMKAEAGNECTLATTSDATAAAYDKNNNLAHDVDSEGTGSERTGSTGSSLSVVSVQSPRKKSTSSSWSKKIRAVFLFLFLVAVILMIIFFPVKKALVNSASWVKSKGTLGYFCYTIAFTIEIVMGIPSTVFEALSGFIFGFWRAVLVTTVGKTSGCMAAFGIGRFLGKDTIGVYLYKRFPVFKALSKVLSNSGIKVLFLFQMAYVPIFIKCFGLSIMDVDAFQFFVSVVICGIPYTFFWSYIGSESNDLLKVLSGEKKRADISTEKIVFLCTGVVAGVVAMGVLARYTKQQLNLINKEHESRVKGNDCNETASSRLSSLKKSMVVMPEKLVHTSSATNLLVDATELYDITPELEK